MDTCRPCGCKGCRTCLLCEEEYGIKKDPILNKTNGSYVYCPHCNKAWSGWDFNLYKQHPNHSGTSIDYPGVYIDLNFLSIEEEQLALSEIENIPWDASQSGRRKQNFGPKCNFKKKKLKLGDFKGFPKGLQFIQEKLKHVAYLKDFQTIEQCSLEYDPTRGASIDPHIDDCWIWGERIVTVNLLADSVLTMTENSKPSGYNLNQVASYPSVMLKRSRRVNKVFQLKTVENAPIVRIPMPRRSLLVLYGAPRYDWEHQVLREDISNTRICLAYREFTPPYLNGGEFYEEGLKVLNKAKEFF
ncbi:LOW QUALITY PROTEIN: alpha-ketoglutarate-dependent dioxygenase alkB homolog 4-like [Atheta coriaria]|uniref:LOW QUALITY PROTEIN: alpha-ketoglutarate-dependent dioxygenase alkB homolog 4-like n=1 Tax=Dalotia coriaria TaxID=877792 RepID=UPI0031F39935